jgi:hypothetical protein
MKPPPQSHSKNTWWELATQRSVVRRGIGYAVVVGAVLIAINHGNSVLRGDLTSERFVKMALTVIVPYLVSTFSSVGALHGTPDNPRSQSSGRH